MFLSYESSSGGVIQASHAVVVRASGSGCDGTQDREFEDAGAIAEGKVSSIGAVQNPDLPL